MNTYNKYLIIKLRVKARRLTSKQRFSGSARSKAQVTRYGNLASTSHRPANLRRCDWSTHRVDNYPLGRWAVSEQHLLLLFDMPRKTLHGNSYSEIRNADVSQQQDYNKLTK